MSFPHTFADFALSQRLERAEGASCARFAEARARAQPEIGAEVISVAGAYVVFDGPASPVTQTFGLGMFDPISAAELERIEGFFRKHDAPVFHEVSPLAGVELHALLAKRGYQPVELTSVMYRDLQLASKTPSSIRVRVVEENQRALWAHTMAQGWAETPEVTVFLLDLADIITQKENTQAFLAEMDGAEMDGQAVAAASLSMEGGVALLAGGATIPQARRKGAQSALLDARLRFAALHGCDLAMMGAAPGSASQRNAERNGFRIAYTRVKWALA